jgi:hypothetical protein
MSKFLNRLMRMVMSALPMISISGIGHAAPPAPMHLMTGWVAARSADSTEAYARFILENPDSPHVAEAKARISTLGQLDQAIARKAAPLVAPAIERQAIDGMGGSVTSRLMNI